MGGASRSAASVDVGLASVARPASGALADEAAGLGRAGAVVLARHSRARVRGSAIARRHRVRLLARVTPCPAVARRPPVCIAGSGVTPVRGIAVPVAAIERRASVVIGAVELDAAAQHGDQAVQHRRTHRRRCEILGRRTHSLTPWASISPADASQMTQGGQLAPLRPQSGRGFCRKLERKHRSDRSVSRRAARREYRTVGRRSVEQRTHLSLANHVEPTRRVQPPRRTGQVAALARSRMCARSKKE